MEVFPNWTAIPIVFFLIVLTFILNRLFFIPLGKTVEERHHRIGGAQKEAEEIKQASRERLAEFDRKMRDARREADLQMVRIKNAALNEKSAIVSGKRSEVEGTLAEARKSLSQKKEEARKTLESETQTFAYRIASRVLGRNITPRKPVKT